MKKIFVTSLPWKATDGDLEKFFEKYGTVVSAQVIIDRDTGRSKGFGFVEFASKDQADYALDADGTEMDGRKIVVKIAQPKKG